MIFRNPKFGNSFSIDTGVKVRRSLDGELLIARGQSWPNIESFSMEFEALTDAQMQAMMDFCSAMAGDEFNIQDHEGTLWLGVIKSPEIEFRQAKRVCGWTTKFEFEGKRVS
jgi:hypothetical protein